MKCQLSFCLCKPVFAPNLAISCPSYHLIIISSYLITHHSDHLAASTSCKCSSRRSTRRCRRDAASCRRSSTRTSFPRAPSVCRFWTSTRTGAPCSASSRCCWAFRNCSPTPTQTIPSRQRPTTSFGNTDH